MQDDPTPPADSLPELQDVDLRRRLLRLVVTAAAALVVSLFFFRDEMIVRHEYTWPVTRGSALRSVPADAEATIPLKLDIEMRGIRRGLIPAVRPMSIQASWYGARSRAASVKVSDYQAIVEFGDRGRGQWTLPILVNGPDSEHLVLEPDSVRVVLR